MLVTLFTVGIGPAYLYSEKNSCEFVVIIPSYNNVEYAEENLESVCWQKSTNPYEIIYINDCSSDRTGEVVEAYAKEHSLESKVTIINNEKRLGSGIANIYYTVHNHVADHKIVVVLDGDDLLPDNDVLLTLEKYYSDQDIWMTYSKWCRFPEHAIGGIEVTEDLYRENLIRKYGWVNALRTFKAALFKKIKKEDLCYEGDFMTVSWDVAFTLPMIEMCQLKDKSGTKHSVFIDKVLYLYRNDGPLHDFKLQWDYQREVENYIRTLEPYEPLEVLEIVPQQHKVLQSDTSTSQLLEAVSENLVKVAI